MLRATSPAPPELLKEKKESQPETPVEKQKPFDGFGLYRSPLPGSGFRVDSDGCSTAAPSPMTEMHPSPWGTPWQGLTSPDCQTSDDFAQESPWNPKASDAPRSSGLNASFPFRNMYEEFDGLSVTHSPPPWSPLAAVTAPPPVTEAAWLEAENAFSGQAAAALGAESVQSATAVPPETPPRTPRKSTTLNRDHPKTAPGAPKKFTSERTHIFRALQSDSVSAAKEALANDPDAAWTPFWEGSWEPPLCSAVRRVCDPAIVSLLLEHRADANAEDREGQTALALLNAASDAYPYYDLLPLRLPFSEPTPGRHLPDSFPTVLRSRQVRVQRIASILIEAGATIGNN